MKFEALARFVSRPIHEQAMARVNHRDGNQHVHQNSKRRDAAQESQDQAESAEELRDNCQKGEERWNAHAAEETHGAIETGAAPPAEHLLCTVSKHHDAKPQARNSERGGIPSAQ